MAATSAPARKGPVKNSGQPPRGHAAHCHAPRRPPSSPELCGSGSMPVPFSCRLDANLQRTPGHRAVNARLSTARTQRPARSEHPPATGAAIPARAPTGCSTARSTTPVSPDRAARRPQTTRPAAARAPPSKPRRSGSPGSPWERKKTGLAPCGQRETKPPAGREVPAPFFSLAPSSDAPTACGSKPAGAPDRPSAGTGRSGSRASGDSGTPSGTPTAKPPALARSTAEPTATATAARPIRSRRGE